MQALSIQRKRTDFRTQKVIDRPFSPSNFRKKYVLFWQTTAHAIQQTAVYIIWDFAVVFTRCITVGILVFRNYANYQDLFYCINTPLHTYKLIKH